MTASERAELAQALNMAADYIEQALARVRLHQQNTADRPSYKDEQSFGDVAEVARRVRAIALKL